LEVVAIADTVADVLGIRKSDPFLLMSAVEQGLPLASLDRVVRSVAPYDNKFAYRIVPRATLARRRGAWAASKGQTTAKFRNRATTSKAHAVGRLSAEEGTRLARLASVWAMALDVWGGQEAARQFMFAEHPLLHGRRPIDIVLENELGRPIVEGVLGRLQYGSAV
jgi:uncharacterized protein (DUF2384 family)